DGGAGQRSSSRRAHSHTRRCSFVFESSRTGPPATDARAASAAHDDFESGGEVDLRLSLRRLHARALRSSSVDQGTDRHMIVSIIAAVSDNNTIGRDNRIPWRQSADLKRFKALTMAHHLLMDRKTYESLAFAPPGRTVIVVTHERQFRGEG